MSESIHLVEIPTSTYIYLGGDYGNRSFSSMMKILNYVNSHELISEKNEGTKGQIHHDKVLDPLQVGGRSAYEVG